MEEEEEGEQPIRPSQPLSPYHVTRTAIDIHFKCLMTNTSSLEPGTPYSLRALPPSPNPTVLLSLHGPHGTSLDTWGTFDSLRSSRRSQFLLPDEAALCLPPRDYPFPDARVRALMAEVDVNELLAREAGSTLPPELFPLVLWRDVVEIADIELIPPEVHAIVVFLRCVATQPSDSLVGFRHVDVVSVEARELSKKWFVEGGDGEFACLSGRPLRVLCDRGSVVMNGDLGSSFVPFALVREATGREKKRKKKKVSGRKKRKRKRKRKRENSAASVPTGWKVVRMGLGCPHYAGVRGRLTWGRLRSEVGEVLRQVLRHKEEEEEEEEEEGEGNDSNSDEQKEYIEEWPISIDAGRRPFMDRYLFVGQRVRLSSRDIKFEIEWKPACVTKMRLSLLALDQAHEPLQLKKGNLLSFAEFDESVAACEAAEDLQELEAEVHYGLTRNFDDPRRMTDKQKVYLHLPYADSSIVAFCIVIRGSRGIETLESAWLSIQKGGLPKSVGYIADLRRHFAEPDRGCVFLCCTLVRSGPDHWILNFPAEEIERRRLIEECAKQLPQETIDLELVATREQEKLDEEKRFAEQLAEKLNRIEDELEALMWQKGLTEEEFSSCPEFKQVRIPKSRYRFSTRATGLDKMDFFGKSDPYFKIYLHSDPENEVFKSRMIRTTLEPEWGIRESHLHHKPCADLSQIYVLRMWDWNRVKKHDYMGTFEFCLQDLVDGTRLEYTLYNPDKRGSNKAAGTFFFGNVSVIDESVGKMKRNRKYRKLKEKIATLGTKMSHLEYQRVTVKARLEEELEKGSDDEED